MKVGFFWKMSGLQNDFMTFASTKKYIFMSSNIKWMPSNKLSSESISDWGFHTLFQTSSVYGMNGEQSKRLINV